MKVHFSGTETIKATRAEVRAFVLDPDRVGRCLPDLQELQVADERHFTAVVRMGVGPVRGRFKLEVELTPDAAGDAAAISIRGAGLGSGLAMNSQIRLADVADGTDLDWEAEANVSGPLATVGGRLLEGQAKKTIEQLFASIRQNLETVGV